jgi:hypothetical protein
MRTQIRSIKQTPLGKYSRAKIRTAVTGVHVLETASGGSWEVRTLGEKGYTKLFDARKSAIQYAKKLKPGADVVVHQLEPKKVTVVHSDKTVKPLDLKAKLR